MNEDELLAECDRAMAMLKATEAGAGPASK
jgi:hypothetical protein